METYDFNLCTNSPMGTSIYYFFLYESQLHKKRFTLHKCRPTQVWYLSPLFHWMDATRRVCVEARNGDTQVGIKVKKQDVVKNVEIQRTHAWKIKGLLFHSNLKMRWFPVYSCKMCLSFHQKRLHQNQCRGMKWRHTFSDCRLTKSIWWHFKLKTCNIQYPFASHVFRNRQIPRIAVRIFSFGDLVNRGCPLLYT